MDRTHFLISIRILFFNFALLTNVGFAQEEGAAAAANSYNRAPASRLEQRTVYNPATQRYETRYIPREWSGMTGQSVPTYIHSGGGMYQAAGDAKLTAPGFVPPTQPSAAASHTTPTPAPSKPAPATPAPPTTQSATPTPQKAAEPRPGTNDYALKNYREGVITTRGGYRFNVLVDPSGHAYYRSDLAGYRAGTPLKDIGAPMTGTSLRNAGGSYKDGRDATVKN